MAANPVPAVPNHHAAQAGFSGITGLVAGLTMLIGRGAIGSLACDLVAVTSGDHVVDLGCGPGAAVREAARRGARVTGIDPAPVMLKLARRFTGPGTPAAWLGGAAEHIPLADGTATAVWSIAAVHHWPDLDGGLAEVLRVLAPGGRLLVIERRTRPGARGLASHGWYEEQAETFTELCRAAGFTGAVASAHLRGRHSMLAVQAVKPGG